MRKLLQGMWVILCVLPLAGQAAVKGEAVEYTSGDVTMKGWLAYDDSKTDKRPGVLVVHEWWGHNAYARKRAEMLAELGYTALAVDMYGEGKNTEHPKEAGEFMKAVTKDMDNAQARFMAALETLKNHPTTDADKTAAIGYCFGGGMVLQMARRGVDLDGVASFHGALATDTPAKFGQVKAAVFVAHGEADPMVKPEDVKALEDEMRAAAVSYFKYFGYPGVKHSFTNPEADKFAKEFDLPVAYNKDADEDSWEQLQKFFKHIFKE